jgi:hypothetical protein
MPIESIVTCIYFAAEEPFFERRRRTTDAHSLKGLEPGHRFRRFSPEHLRYEEKKKNPNIANWIRYRVKNGEQNTDGEKQKEKKKRHRKS